MYNQKVIISQQFPVADKNRKSTDVFCTIVSAIIPLTIFIVACCVCSKQNNDKIFSPADNDGKICGVDYPDKKLLYLSNPKDITTRKCINECPFGYYQQNIYSGSLCLPKNSDIRNEVLKHSSLTSIWDYYNTKVALAWTIFISICFAILWMTLVHCFPRTASIIALFGSAFFLLIVGIIIIADSQSFWTSHPKLRVILSVFCFLLLITMIVMLFMYSNSVKFQGYFLQYAAKLLGGSPYAFGYIPIFMALTVGLIALCLFQHWCFSSMSVTKRAQQVYYSPTINMGVMINIFQFIWGLQFLRDAFHYCISGYVVDWYWTDKQSFVTPFKRLLTRNWGSVVGGSLLNGFFEIPTLIVQLLTCHPYACCSKMGTLCYKSCGYLTCFFDLVRTDSYAYINLSGIPFCNSAKECKKLCSKSKHFIGTFCPLKHYRLAAHIFCCSLLFIICYFILKQRTWDFRLWGISLLVVAIYVSVAYLVDMHGDTAQALSICFLVQYQLEGQYPYLQKCLPSVKKYMQMLESKDVMDGNC